MLGELSRDQIETMLYEHNIGRIGCHDQRGIYIVPITYVYDGESIIGHTATGKKIDMMRNNDQVCFQVDDIKDMANWRSVIAWGLFEELKGQEAIEALRLYANRLAPLLTSDTARVQEHLTPDPLVEGAFKSLVYRIRLGKKTGRYERKLTGNDQSHLTE